MKISILCSSPQHPVNTYIDQWMSVRRAEHEIELYRRRSDLVGGDILFLVSCGEIVPKTDRARFKASLVLHASDLPKGRGWNPHIWTLLDGAESVTVTLLEAEDKVDTGAIWAQRVVPIPRHSLWDEVNDRIFKAEVELLDVAIAQFPNPRPRPQSTKETTAPYRLRTPDDSRLDPQRSIAEQFDLLRLCDPHRYPAFFDFLGHRYRLTLEKMHDQTRNEDR